MPYGQALDLKELGFNEPCFGFYNDDNVPIGGSYPCLGNNRAPLWQQAFLYLWNKTGRYIIPIPNNDKEWLCMGNKFKTYEEARLECLKKLIEIVKNG